MYLQVAAVVPSNQGVANLSMRKKATADRARVVVRANVSGEGSYRAITRYLRKLQAKPESLLHTSIILSVRRPYAPLCASSVPRTRVFCYCSDYTCLA